MAQQDKSIDESAIRAIVSDDISGQFVDFEHVIGETRRLLGREPQQLAEHYQTAGLVFRFALLAPDGGPSLLVDVNEAIFSHDEASNAVLTAGTMSRLRAKGSRAVYAVVVAGYVSPEILENLQAVVNELIIFTPETFEQEAGAMLSRVRERDVAMEIVRHPETSPSSPSAAEEPIGLQKLEDLLRNIVEERNQTAMVIGTRASESTTYYENRRKAERWRTWLWTAGGAFVLAASAGLVFEYEQNRIASKAAELQRQTAMDQQRAAMDQRAAAEASYRRLESVLREINTLQEEVAAERAAAAKKAPAANYIPPASYDLLKAAQQAYDLERMRYTVGTESYTTVVRAHENLVAASLAVCKTAKDRIGVYQSAISVASKDLELTQSRFEGGVASKSDVAEAQRHLSDLQVQLDKEQKSAIAP